MKMKKRFLNMFIIILALSLAFCHIAYAEETVSITALYDVIGAQINLYYVGNIDEYGDAVLCDDFSEYSVSLKNTDSAYTLYLYAMRDEIEPVSNGVISDEKEYVFSDLKKGIYLLAGSDVIKDNKKYSIVPSIVYVDGDMTVYCKNVEEEFTEYKNISVVKIWEDKAYESNRPEAVEVQLLKNGKLEDEIILNKENQWQYSWENLDGEYSWEVVEKRVPKGYEVSIEYNNHSFTIVNSYTSTDSKLPPSKTDVSGGKLPQTGQSWLPVPILIILGLSAIIAGGVIRRTGVSYEK